MAGGRVHGASPRSRAFGPQLALALGILVGSLGPAHGDGGPAAGRPTALRAAADLDGLHLFVGPNGAATHIGGGWDSAWGGHLALVRVREHARLGAAGVWLGGAHYAATDGGRLWLEGLAGTRRMLGRMIGVGAGPVVELGQLHHPRVGAQGSIWCFVGVVPYARLGVLDASGPFVEVGVSLSIPTLRF